MAAGISQAEPTVPEYASIGRDSASFYATLTAPPARPASDGPCPVANNPLESLFTDYALEPPWMLCPMTREPAVAHTPEWLDSWMDFPEEGVAVKDLRRAHSARRKRLPMGPAEPLYKFIVPGQKALS